MERWNHNIHYQRLVLDRIPAGTTRALDVGCGEGFLTRALRERVPTVVGIDRHGPSIAAARAHCGDVDYLEADVLHADLPTFDVVTSIAAVHHLDTAQALDRLRELTAPGGRLIVIGCARRSLPHDLPWEIAGAVQTRVLKLRHSYWQHSAPIVDPPLTNPETRRVARTVLPDARYRQLAMWRYLLDWRAPLQTP